MNFLRFLLGEMNGGFKKMDFFDLIRNFWLSWSGEIWNELNLELLNYYELNNGENLYFNLREVFVNKCKKYGAKSRFFGLGA